MRLRTFAGSKSPYRIKLQELRGPRRGMHRRAPVWLLALSLSAFGTADGWAAPQKKPASPQHKKTVEATHHKTTLEGPHHKHGNAQRAEDAVPVPPELAAAKQAIVLVRHGNAKDATALVASIDDPVAAKLVEWTLLRDSDSEAGFDRYAAFIQANADWPSIPLLRRRAEARLWQERRDGPDRPPFRRQATGQRSWPARARARVAGRGRSRRRRARSSRACGSQRKCRPSWKPRCSSAFPDVFDPPPTTSRAWIGASAPRTSARRCAPPNGLVRVSVAIVKACEAAEANSTKAKALLDEVPTDAREDLGYALCRVHWLLRNDTPGSNVHDDRDTEGSCGCGQADAHRVA